MEGKVIAITGGASGIGLALAKILASRGAKLSIADVSQPNLEKAKGVIQEVGAASDSIFVQQTDVRNLEQVESWIKATVEKFGKLDGAANMAGVIGTMQGISSQLANQNEEDWDFVIGVNLTVGLTQSLKMVW
jgi:NAD(P)-dependent dehydrogenase (short-subunit alcohol dehydrogenase family)